jgi:hypothetical protein
LTISGIVSHNKKLMENLYKKTNQTGINEVFPLIVSLPILVLRAKLASAMGRPWTAGESNSNFKPCSPQGL